MIASLVRAELLIRSRRVVVNFLSFGSMSINMFSCFQIESLQADNDFAKEQLAAMKGRLIIIKKNLN